VNIVVLVSGRGTDLQSIIDAVEEGWLKVNIKAVISDKEDAYALERAKQHGIPTYVLSKKVLKSQFQDALLDLLAMLSPDLIVLAGFLTILSPKVVEHFPQKIINIHPALLPSFCGKGFYGMKVHEAVYEKWSEVHRLHGALCRCWRGCRPHHSTGSGQSRRRRYA